MALPFPSTIARDRVVLNARHLEAEGHSKGEAYAKAFSEARKSYFRQHPQGVLPKWLAIAGKTHKDDYNSDGGIYREARNYQENPTKPRAARSLSVRAAARLYEGFTGDAPRDAVTIDIPGVPFKVGFIVGHVLALELAAGLLKFAPNDGGGLPALTVSHDGKQCAFIGGDYEPVIEAELTLDNRKILAIMYRTVRDGRTENYRHPFAKFAQPALLVLDARNAKMSGGSFRFTDRGFVDKRK